MSAQVTILVPQKKWTTLTEDEKESLSDNLINLVQEAYKKAKRGSFVNKTGEVMRSEWVCIDINGDGIINAAIFYRKSRSNEPWKGYKIQGIGHDGKSKSKSEVIKKLVELLKQEGWWMEVSQDLEKVLYAKKVRYVNNEAFARRIFQDPELHIIREGEEGYDKNFRGRYRRRVKGGEIVTDTIFGHPRF